MQPPRRYRSAADLPPVIPIFPLTGVLLLPRARLPLNIFEPRYLAMVDAAMSGSRLIAMVQPKIPNSEKRTKPALSDIGCLGRIVDYSETDDGRYMITLLGLTRFRIAGEREDADTPYRLVAADYAAFASDFRQESEPGMPRARLIAALRPYLQDREMQTDWSTIDEAPEETLVNALAMLCPFGPAEKQALLEAPTLKARTEALVALLEMANAQTGGNGGSTPHLN
jgi:Lon protease-like protein